MEEKVRTVSVILGDKDYAIFELPSKKNQIWREQYSEVMKSELPIAEEMNKEYPISEVVPKFDDLIKISSDKALNLLKDYAPYLPWETIEEEIFDSELVEALKGVFGLAFPFDSMMVLLSIVREAAG
jgi:hypothetical protein